MRTGEFWQLLAFSTHLKKYPRRHGAYFHPLHCDVSLIIQFAKVDLTLNCLPRYSYSLGYDGSLLNGLQALPAWGSTFKHPAGYDLGLIAAAYYLYALFVNYVSLANVDLEIPVAPRSRVLLSRPTLRIASDASLLW